MYSVEAIMALGIFRSGPTSLCIILMFLSRSVTGDCPTSSCQLPNCRCPGSDIPGGIPVEQTPMMVLLTFDDGIASWSNLKYYQDLNQQNYKNPNNCSAKFSFYVSGDNYQNTSIREVYEMGHEFGSHSMSHRFPIEWWETAGYNTYKREMVGMKNILSTIIPKDEIRGVRVPFLQIGGDDQYRMLQDNGFLYDTSMVAKNLSWPFTLDYPVNKTYCAVSSCPTSPYRGLWEIPLNVLNRKDGYQCSMADDCKLNGTVQEIKDYLYDNFNRHFNSNKVPFGIYVHATWFTKAPYSFQATMEFMQEMSERDDVWLVSEYQLLDWTMHPRPVVNNTEVDLDSWKCSDSPSRTGCNEENCQLPNCRCPGTDIPGKIPVEKTPMMVLLTFDDGISEWANINFYRRLDKENYINPNNCSAKFTFFVSADNYQNSSIVEVYEMGHEFGSHSLSHRFPQSWWETAGYENYKAEMVGMRDLLSIFIPPEELRGMRVPFLQIGGDDQYRMMQENGFVYDSSMVAQSLSWPFTLDYPVSSTYCSVSSCPTGNYSGLWEIPLNILNKEDGYKCSMADSCQVYGNITDFKEYLYLNFNRHYKTNKTPFGIYVHSRWFWDVKNSFDALLEFLRELNDRGDVWLVSQFQLLEWTRHPTPVVSGTKVDLDSWDCFTTRTTTTTQTPSVSETETEIDTSSSITNSAVENVTSAMTKTSTEPSDPASKAPLADYNIDADAGMIVGIVAAGLVGLMLILVTINMLLSVCRRRREAKSRKKNQNSKKSSDIWDRIDEKSDNQLRKLSLQDAANGTETLRHI